MLCIDSSLFFYLWNFLCVIPVRCFDPLFIRVHQLVFFDGVSFSVIWAEHLLLDLKIFAVNGYNIFYIFQIPLVNAKILQTVVLASFFADFVTMREAAI